MLTKYSICIGIQVLLLLNVCCGDSVAPKNVSDCPGQFNLSFTQSMISALGSMTAKCFVKLPIKQQVDLMSTHDARIVKTMKPSLLSEMSEATFRSVILEMENRTFSFTNPSSSQMNTTTFNQTLLLAPLWQYLGVSINNPLQHPDIALSEPTYTQFSALWTAYLQSGRPEKYMQQLNLLKTNYLGSHYLEYMERANTIELPFSSSYFQSGDDMGTIMTHYPTSLTPTNLSVLVTTMDSAAENERSQLEAQESNLKSIQKDLRQYWDFLSSIDSRAGGQKNSTLSNLVVKISNDTNDVFANFFNISNTTQLIEDRASLFRQLYIVFALPRVMKAYDKLKHEGVLSYDNLMDLATDGDYFFYYQDECRELIHLPRLVLYLSDMQKKGDQLMSYSELGEHMKALDLKSANLMLYPDGRNIHTVLYALTDALEYSVSPASHDGDIILRNLQPDDFARFTIRQQSTLFMYAATNESCVLPINVFEKVNGMTFKRIVHYISTNFNDFPWPPKSEWFKQRAYFENFGKTVCSRPTELTNNSSLGNIMRQTDSGNSCFYPEIIFSSFVVDGNEPVSKGAEHDNKNSPALPSLWSEALVGFWWDFLLATGRLPGYVLQWDALEISQLNESHFENQPKESRTQQMAAMSKLGDVIVNLREQLNMSISFYQRAINLPRFHSLMLQCPRSSKTHEIIEVLKNTYYKRDSLLNLLYELNVRLDRLFNDNRFTRSTLEMSDALVSSRNAIASSQGSPTGALKGNRVDYQSVFQLPALLAKFNSGKVQIRNSSSAMLELQALNNKFQSALNLNLNLTLTANCSANSSDCLTPQNSTWSSVFYDVISGNFISRFFKYVSKRLFSRDASLSVPDIKSNLPLLTPLLKPDSNPLVIEVENRLDNISHQCYEVYPAGSCPSFNQYVDSYQDNAVQSQLAKCFPSFSTEEQIEFLSFPISSRSFFQKLDRIMANSSDLTLPLAHLPTDLLSYMDWWKVKCVVRALNASSDHVSFLAINMQTNGNISPFDNLLNETLCPSKPWRSLGKNVTHPPLTKPLTALFDYSASSSLRTLLYRWIVATGDTFRDYRTDFENLTRNIFLFADNHQSFMRNQRLSAMGQENELVMGHLLENEDARLENAKRNLTTFENSIRGFSWNMLNLSALSRALAIIADEADSSYSAGNNSAITNNYASESDLAVSLAAAESCISKRPYSRRTLSELSQNTTRVPVRYNNTNATKAGTSYSKTFWKLVRLDWLRSGSESKSDKWNFFGFWNQLNGQNKSVQNVDQFMGDIVLSINETATTLIYNWEKNLSWLTNTWRREQSVMQLTQKIIYANEAFNVIYSNSSYLTGLVVPEPLFDESLELGKAFFNLPRTMTEMYNTHWMYSTNSSIISLPFSEEKLRKAHIQLVERMDQYITDGAGLLLTDFLEEIRGLLTDADAFSSPQGPDGIASSYVVLRDQNVIHSKHHLYQDIAMRLLLFDVYLKYELDQVVSNSRLARESQRNAVLEKETKDYLKSQKSALRSGPGLATKLSYSKANSFFESPQTMLLSAVALLSSLVIHFGI